MIFVLVDDLGFANLGCYGSQSIQTPRLDQMAREGMRFLNAYSGCTVCAPARSVLMTGKHMGHTSVRVNSGGVPLLDADVTIAEVLKQAGYTCGGFGKWALGDLDTEGVPEQQGFDRFFGYYHQFHAHLTFPEYLIDNGRKIEYPGNRNFNIPFGGPRPEPGFTPVVNPHTGQPLRYAHYEVFRETLDFIRDNHDRSFFCFAPWTPPHGRYQIPASDPAATLYRDKPWSERSRVFAAMTSMIDRQMGELLDLLSELEIDNNTIVIFCSDHGAPFRADDELNSSGPYRGYKRSMYEGGLRVPMLVRWPGRIATDSETGHVCTFTDILPTLAELAGASDHVPADIDGISLVPTLLGKPDQQAQHPLLYWQWARFNPENNRYGDSMQAIRRGNLKLLRNSEQEPWELYDLKTDPYETTNIAGERSRDMEELILQIGVVQRPPREQREPDKPADRRFR
ncbi:MAG: arylsulfatase [Pirellulaceae bacterium]